MRLWRMFLIVSPNSRFVCRSDDFYVVVDYIAHVCVICLGSEVMFLFVLKLTRIYKGEGEEGKRHLLKTWPFPRPVIRTTKLISQ